MGKATTVPLPPALKRGRFNPKPDDIDDMMPIRTARLPAD